MTEAVNGFADDGDSDGLIKPTARVLLRVNLDHLRLNLKRVTGGPQTEDEVVKLLALLGVRRRDEDWFVADATATRVFLDGEVLEQRIHE